MSEKPVVSIIDMGLGNLFSIQRALDYVGIDGVITSSVDQILDSAGVILPGVGAFGAAINTLRKLHIDVAVHEIVEQKKPLLAICLGMQLLMTKSYEFGVHKGLNIFKGNVLQFSEVVENGKLLKVPHVGWSRIFKTEKENLESPSSEMILDSVENGEYMYFVHSYYVDLLDTDYYSTYSIYGNIKFCSSIENGNIFACQFHPERSGPAGLKTYQKFAYKIFNNRGR